MGGAKIQLEVFPLKGQSDRAIRVFLGLPAGRGLLRQHRAGVHRGLREALERLLGRFRRLCGSLFFFFLERVPVLGV